MRLKTIVPHTYDGRSYQVGDEYDVADPTIAETIVANGMAGAVLETAPSPPPSPPPPTVHVTHAKDHNARKPKS